MGENMENKSKELTFADLLEIIFKRKILLTAITLIITIAGTLLLGVVYNNDKAQYTTSFILDYPGSTTLTLPDGSNLKYTEFISEQSLLQVKNSNPDYKNIDVKKLALSSDISISQEIVTNSANRSIQLGSGQYLYLPHSGRSVESEMLRLGAPVTGSQLQHLISSLARHHCAFNSSHLYVPPI